MQGVGRYKLHFFPWFEGMEYSEPTQLEYRDLDEAERELYPRIKDYWARQWGYAGEWILHGQTMRMLEWRRVEMVDMDDSDSVHGSNLFPQEFPSTPEEAFVASGRGVFGVVNVDPVEPKGRDRFFTWWEEPQRGTAYIIGVDVGAGIGGDRSVVWVLNADEMVQAAEWVSDSVDPVELAEYVSGIARQYNNAWVVPELNNHGLATIEALRSLYTPSRILQRYNYDKRAGVERMGRLGWLTTAKTKAQMVSYLRQAVHRGGLKVRSPECVQEISTYIEHKSGKLGAAPGCYDDRVIAASLAVAGYHHCYARPLVQEPEVEPEMSFRRQRKMYIDGYVEEHGQLPGDARGFIDTGYVS